MYGKEYNGISIDKKLNKYTCIENNKYFEGKDIRYVIEELKKVNNLSNSNLTEGDKIRIPNY